MQQPIKHFIAQNSPDWIILDFFPHWLADLTIPLIFYSVFSCSTNVFFGPPEFLTGDGQKKFRSTPESVASPPPWVNFPSKVAYTIEEAGFVQHGFFGVNASGISDSARTARVIGASRAIAIRSCPELEADYLQLFSKITGKPVIPVGLLPPTTIVKQEPWSGVFSWLDRHSPATVVFVGFGSETKLSRAEIHEIAYGVELSGMPFLWSLRLPAGDDDLDSALPPGFRSRTGERGLVEVGWAPQKEILAHPAIGGSFFHAGWGSIIEALQFGHVLIFLPLIIDQPLNARLLADKGLGIEVRRNRDGSLSRDEIADGIREAMLSDQRRARARVAARDVFGDYDLHRGYAHKFADYLKSGGLNAN